MVFLHGFRRSSLRYTAAGLAVLLAASGNAQTAHESINCLEISRLRCEYLEDPEGIDVREPRLSWTVVSSERGQRQTAYQIIAASNPSLLDEDRGDLWDSGKVASSETVHVVYGGRALRSRDVCWWRVRVWDRDGEVSVWSEPAHWTMGLLEPTDWKAKWIGQQIETLPKDAEPPGPLFRKEFTLEAKPVRATAYVAAMGYYELHLNGDRVGDDVCSPVASDYSKRAYYLTYDVKETLKIGANCVGVWLGRGWYCEGFPGVIHPGPIARVQIEIDLEDGSRTCIASDDTWKTHPGPVTAIGRVQHANLDGERYDARDETPGWDAPGLDDAAWVSAAVVAPPTPVLCAPMMQPNRILETIKPVSLEEIAPGEFLFDMGRNLTGMFDLRLQGTAGEPVKMLFIERQEAGTGKWIAYDQQGEYVPRTNGEEVFKNRFNYHAFRYVKVSGLREPPVLDDATAHFVQTDYGDRGSFACSNELLNRIYETTLYTFRCVSAGGTTVDCPHRERLGYGGDAQITSRSALYAFDLGALYTKWLGNWRDAQDPETGALPNIAPSPHPAGGGPTWGAICVFLPWDLYLHYGDRRVLHENYDMMRRYVAFLDSKSENNQMKPFGGPQYGFLGDWVAPGHDQDFGPWSPEEWRIFFNNCFYAHIADRVAKVARVLGEDADAARYAQQAEAIRLATHAKYFKPDTNSYVDGGQAYLSIALLSGVTPEPLRAAVMNTLERVIVNTNSGHIDAGMHGSMFLLRWLNEARRDDLAFLMVNQTTYPGWGYMLEQGATTFWERWDGELSQIHSTLLAAGEWFPRAIGGIKPDEAQPGFKHVIIDPRPVGDLTWAKTQYDTVRGPVISEWRREGERFQLEVEIPANTSGEVHLPAAATEHVRESGVPAAESDGVRLMESGDAQIVFKIESGKYRFEVVN